MYARDDKTVKSPPITSGFAKSAMASTKRSRNELAMPGINIGKVTLRNTLNLEEPKLAAASSSEGSRFFIMPNKFMYATGKNEVVSTINKPG